MVYHFAHRVESPYWFLSMCIIAQSTEFWNYFIFGCGRMYALWNSLWEDDRENVAQIRPFLLADEIAERKLTMEQDQEREKNIKLIKEILEEVTRGHLVKGQQAALFYAERGLKEDIACKNIAC